MNARRWTGWVAMLLAVSTGCDEGEDDGPGVYALGSSAGATEGDSNTSDPTTSDDGTTSGGSTGLPMFTAGTPETSASSLTMAPTTMTTDSSTSGSGDTDGGSSSTGTPTVLPCDEGWTFEPAAPTTAVFFVQATHAEPLAYINLQMVGPNEPTIDFVDVVGENPWMWRFQVTGHAPGQYELVFGNADSEGGPVTVRSRCEIEITP